MKHVDFAFFVISNGSTIKLIYLYKQKKDTNELWEDFVKIFGFAISNQIMIFFFKLFLFLQEIFSGS